MGYKILIYLFSKSKIKSKLITLILVIIIFYFVTSILFFSVNIWDKTVTKFTINKYFQEKNKLKTYLLDIKNLPTLKFPYIIKPIICSGTSRNVALINNDKDLNNYINNIDKDEIYIIQQFYKSKYEIGVLYEKIPYLNDGNIISIVAKKNNTHQWKPLKCGNVKNDETTICDNITKKFENSKFSNIIREISSKIPGFNAGRYDIGFENIDDLNNGKFYIYELNGVMGFDLRSNLTVNDNISEIIKKTYYSLRWLSTRYLIGLLNLISLKISPFNILNIYPNSIKNCIKCSDLEHLFQASPC